MTAQLTPTRGGWLSPAVVLGLAGMSYPGETMLLE